MSTADSEKRETTYQLTTPVQYLRGVGPQRAELLEKLSLRTAADLLFYFPRDYQDMSDVRKVADLEEDQLATVEGTIDEVDHRPLRGGKSMVGFLVSDETGSLRARWFNQTWPLEKFKVGDRVTVAGSPRKDGFRWEIVHPRIDFAPEKSDVAASQSDDDSTAKLDSGEILPVYGLTEGISQHQMRTAVSAAVEATSHLLREALPNSVLDDHQLWPIQPALMHIHKPASAETLEQARRRFVFQELLLLELGLGLRREQTRRHRAPVIDIDLRLDDRIRRRFGFPLTRSQLKAIEDLRMDLRQPIPMNRLLHGDVGSGKTAVALYAILAVVAKGHQAVLMAPTEILARQHFQTFSKQLAESRVRMVLWTGGQTAREKREARTQAEAGEVDVVVATHAVLTGELPLHRLGLVVIDEQHRFGVRQRAVLRQSPKEGAAETAETSTADSSGLLPHTLVMSATPIPRTIALTAFGDLDVSKLDELPPGRQEIKTYLAAPHRRDQWWEFAVKKLRAGRQGFVVAPRIEAADKQALPAVTTIAEELQQGPLAEFQVGVIHGQQSLEEMLTVMNQFRRGKLHVLVATTIVEIGIDVPNASWMAIYGGAHLGLAQLHQLRGRVGRGRFPGVVTVLCDTVQELENERLKAFAETANGFELAEIDLKLRGPGDIFGSRQHGATIFRIADLPRDEEVLMEARVAAERLLKTDTELALPDNERLKQLVHQRYGKVLELGDTA